MPKKAPDYTAIRQEIAALQAERAEIESAPLPRAELLNRLDSVIEHYAAEASGAMGGIINDRRNDFIFTTSEINAGALVEALCAFAPDGVRARFVAKIDAYLDGKQPIAADAKTARFAQIDAELHRLAVEEERAVATAELGGDPIPRRHDIDPAIFLEAHGPSVARVKLRDFGYHQKQLVAAMDAIRDVMTDASREKQRAAGALDRHRSGFRKVRQPVPFTVGQHREMLVTVEPETEKRLVKAALEATAAFDKLQAEYARAGEKNGEFGTGHTRLREALGALLRDAA